MFKKIISSIVLLFVVCAFSVNAQTITLLPPSKQVSIRGLSVVNNKTAWVSGTKGSVGITADGGITWKWKMVKGYEKADFRDIEAFSDKVAIILSSGTPALILKTIDGGLNWQLKYRQNDKGYFLDAMDFANKNHGYILGDPIDGKFLLLETRDAGDTWETVKHAPPALPNEAAFAASGTCLRVNKQITIVTGGSNSRIISSAIGDTAWVATSLPLTNGSPSRGAFSVAISKKQTVIVGGNYSKDTLTDSVAYLLTTKTNNGKVPTSGPTGYQSAVEYINGNTFISTGTSGSNITTDGGLTWRKIDAKSYNTCRKAKNGTLILFAGDGGKIGIYRP